jgi:DHA2 family multidrug resistance protein
LVQTLLTRNTVIVHASLAERVTAGSSAWHNPAVSATFGAHAPAGAALLDGAVTQQASMIAYIDDFWFMLFLTLLVLPLLLLIRPPRGPVTEDAQAVMD